MRSLPDIDDVELVAYRSMPEVLQATADGDVDAGVVAIENALEGMVNVTVDTLIFEVDLLIQDEMIVPVSLDLLGVPGAELSDIEAIASMPVAFGQCRSFLQRELPGAAHRPSDSTAGAAHAVAEAADRSVAALANTLAGERYGLSTLASAVEDDPANATRFVLVAPDRVPPRTGHDRTTVVVFQQHDRPGSLLGILAELAARGINLTRLESRPSRSGRGDYCFLMDLDGHIADEVVADALRSLYAEQARCKFIGSYPAIGADEVAVRADANGARAEAAQWMRDLQSRIDG